MKCLGATTMVDGRNRSAGTLYTILFEEKDCAAVARMTAAALYTMSFHAVCGRVPHSADVKKENKPTNALYVTRST